MKNILYKWNLIDRNTVGKRISRQHVIKRRRRGWLCVYSSRASREMCCAYLLTAAHIIQNTTVRRTDLTRCRWVGGDDLSQYLTVMSQAGEGKSSKWREEHDGPQGRPLNRKRNKRMRESRCVCRKEESEMINSRERICKMSSDDKSTCILWKRLLPLSLSVIRRRSLHHLRTWETSAATRPNEHNNAAK